jgi:outer membrane lipopolysaccharide assembly protein LptE/RlpB
MGSTTGCGYHPSEAVELPQNIHTIAIPGFVSHSQTFRIEQLLTDAVVREFNARTQYHVIHDANGDADAVLKATVLSASANPLVYDSTSGRAVSALVTVSVQVTLTDRQGKVLFDNPVLSVSRAVRNIERPPQFFSGGFSGGRSLVAGFCAYPGGQYPGGLLMRRAIDARLQPGRPLFLGTRVAQAEAGLCAGGR